MAEFQRIAHEQNESQELGSKSGCQPVCPRVPPSGLLPGGEKANSSVVPPFPWGWAGPGVCGGGRVLCWALAGVLAACGGGGVC